MGKRLWMLVASLLGLLGAGPASATVIIDHVFVGPTEFTLGDTFQIEVRVSWDGQGDLYGIFASTGSSNSVVVVADSATFNTNNMYRRSLFTFFDPETEDITTLTRFGQNQLRQAVDGTNVIRSVQYGSLAPIDPRGAASNVLVTTITFRVVAPGQTEISTFLALGDNGAMGDELVVGAPICVSSEGLCGPVPEPGTALMLGLGLAVLSSLGRPAISGSLLRRPDPPERQE